MVTCRTEDYARIVYQAGAPLARTPVIALGALAIDDVIRYLKDTNLLQGPSAGRWDRLLEYLVTEPDGPLAIAMTSPLVVWLVRTNYKGGNPAPTTCSRGAAPWRTSPISWSTGWSTPRTRSSRDQENMERYEALKPEDREIQRERLVYFADYLSRQLPKVDGKPGGENRLDIEWWYLPRAVPEWFTGGTVGLISGCLLGASVGLAATIKFGHSVGLVVGIGVRDRGGRALSGMTSVRWQEVRGRSVSAPG